MSARRTHRPAASESKPPTSRRGAAGDHLDAMYFNSPAAFGKWLEAHHANASELWVGFWKAGTGQPTLTWSQSVDEALCFGWIDGVRRSVDDRRYAIRFTPRTPGSIWSEINLRKVETLLAAGRMRPAGIAAHAQRDEAKTSRYSYERANAAFDQEQVRQFQTHAAAWAWFQSQPPGYRRLIAHWVTSAKRPETRARRLVELIEASGAKRRVGLIGK